MYFTPIKVGQYGVGVTSWSDTKNGSIDSLQSVE